jgi:hypothetical protein
MKPKLRCKIGDLVPLAGRYSYQSSELDLSGLKDGIQDRGHLSKDELRSVARWKSPRSAGRMERNSDEFVREITAAALGANNERTRIESLTLLDGVGWPTASVILHFFHNQHYPIIDFRALWTISLDVPSSYRFEVWQPYVEFCRNIACRSGLDMRTLDRALWQYSKENQEPV